MCSAMPEVNQVDFDYPQPLGNRVHIDFPAPDRERLDDSTKSPWRTEDVTRARTREKDNANYYGAFVSDLDGNKTEAVTYSAGQL
jgi:hypothetical protein